MEVYRTRQLNFPSKNFGDFTDGSLFHRFPPLYDGQDSQKAKFCNFKWNAFALICTLRFCLNIHSFNFALIYIFLMKMTQKNDPQSIFSERRQKNFYGRVSLLFFRGGGGNLVDEHGKDIKCDLCELFTNLEHFVCFPQFL